MQLFRERDFFISGRVVKIRQSKRNRVSTAAAALGITSLLEACPRRDSLIVLNYHRIGNWRDTPYDENVFSADEADFATQMSLIKRTTTVVSLDEALKLLLKAKSFRGIATLLTFDDGYIDNYRKAYPILQSMGLPATFFLVTSFIGSNDLPWWDQIAYLVRNSELSQIELDYPHQRSLLLGIGRRYTAIEEVINLYIASPDPEKFLEHLRDALKTERRISPDRMFLNWAEAREMIARGMDIGAHTHSHRCLARLSLEEQIRELDTSRRLLEEGLMRRIDVLAYPYGTEDSFDSASFVALQRTGYRAAFSYYGGLNLSGKVNPFNLMRFDVDRTISPARYRLRLATAPLLDGYWF
jgi:peptidoglycan/xylan/chitin deacetylase (PgdA/CDA1 family)